MVTAEGTEVRQSTIYGCPTPYLWWRKFKIKCTGHLGCLLIRIVIRNNTKITEHMSQGHTESIDLIKCQIIIIIKFNVRMKPLGYGMPLLDGMFGGNMTLKRCCRTPTPRRSELAALG